MGRGICVAATGLERGHSLVSAPCPPKTNLHLKWAKRSTQTTGSSTRILITRDDGLHIASKLFEWLSRNTRGTVGMTIVLFILLSIY